MQLQTQTTRILTSISDSVAIDLSLLLWRFWLLDGQDLDFRIDEDEVESGQDGKDLGSDDDSATEVVLCQEDSEFCLDRGNFGLCIDEDGLALGSDIDRCRLGSCESGSTGGRGRAEEREGCNREGCE